MFFTGTIDLPHVNAIEIAAEQNSESKLGILSPECQKMREIAAIKQDLFEKFGNSINIENIQKDGDTYFITTNEWEMTVLVTYLPPLNPDLIGAPQRFELTFFDPVKK